MRLGHSMTQCGQHYTATGALTDGTAVKLDWFFMRVYMSVCASVHVHACVSVWSQLRFMFHTTLMIVVHSLENS